MTVGCPHIAGPACRDCDGSCWYPPDPDLGPPPPTDDELCESMGHPYYGDDPDGSEGAMGRCWCGGQTYPAGGS